MLWNCVHDSMPGDEKSMEIWGLVQHDVSHPQDPSRPHPDVWAYVYLFGQARHPSSRLASNVLTDCLWGNFDIGPA